jgi:predicted transcriptional regulator YdeE
MKIVKYIFLLLLLASIAATVFIATQDGKYNIKKERIINVSRPVLYNYLNDYKNWENLGFFASADTTATFTYSDISAGKGAFMSWTKEGESGRIQTEAVTTNDSISQKATLDNLDANVTWAFKDTLKSTKVSIRLSGRLTFSEKAYALLNGGIDNSMDSSLEKGMVNLNNFLVKEIQKYSTEVVGVVNKKETFYLGTNASLPIADVNKKAIVSFDKLLAFAKENNITVTGKPFILYNTINKEAKTASCTYSIPIKDEMFTAPGSDYIGGKLASFNALKTTLRGDYSHLPKAWEAARKHLREKALPENTTAQYLEMYTKSVAQTRRPSMLITDVYIPIGTPKVTVTDTLVPAAIRTVTTPISTGTKPATTSAATPVRKPAAVTNGSTTTTRPATSTTAKPTTTGTAKPAITTTKSTSVTTKPASTTVKPATTTAKPAVTATKPAATTAKPAATQSKPAGTNTTKPATTTPAKPAVAKPATTTPAKPKPSNTNKSGTDDLNPPRA